MITGENTFKIDFRDWLRGMTTSDEVEDGGFSQQTTAVNLIAEPGVINAPGLITDKSTNLTDEIIADSDNPGATLSNEKMFLAADGKFITWNGTTLTVDATGGGTQLYTQGMTQMVPFNGKWYATNKLAGGSGDITEWDGAGTIDETWWSVTKSKGTLTNTTPVYPLLFWNNRLWIGEKNMLHSIDSSGTIVTALTLENVDDTIMALGIDKGTGLLLISTADTRNHSTTRASNNTVLVYDGSIDTPNRTVVVNGTVTAFHSLGSSTYAFYNNKMGRWTGRGIKFLREFNFSLAAADLAYPHKVTSTENTMYIVDGNQILAYGQVIGNQNPVFYYALKNNVGSFNDYTIVSNLGNDFIGVSFATSKFYTFDTTAIAQVIAGGASVFSRRYDFSKKRLLKGIRMQFKTLPTVSGSTLFAISYLDDTGTTTLLKTVSTTTGELELDIPITDGLRPTSSMQFKYAISPETATNVPSLRKMIIYHDPAQE